MAQPSEPVVTAEFEPFVRALGVLSLSWSQVEYHLNDFIWFLTNLNRQFGACITAQLIGPGPRIRSIVALMKLRGVSDDLIKEFNSLSADIESAGRQRNRWAHDQLLWHHVQKKMARFEITADRIPKFIAQPTEPADIHAVTLLCEDINRRIENFVRRVVERAPAWPRTEYDQSLDISQLQLQRA